MQSRGPHNSTASVLCPILPLYAWAHPPALCLDPSFHPAEAWLSSSLPDHYAFLLTPSTPPVALSQENLITPGENLPFHRFC